MVIEGENEKTVTEDPEHIRDWMEEHGGKPATTGRSGTVSEELAVKFQDEDDENLQEISWEEFFLILNEKDLAFSYTTDNNQFTLNSQKYDFVERKEANIEMEDEEVFRNTLETADEGDLP